jgi:hypothetical protein
MPVSLASFASPITGARRRLASRSSWSRDRGIPVRRSPQEWRLRRPGCATAPEAGGLMSLLSRKRDVSAAFSGLDGPASEADAGKEAQAIGAYPSHRSLNTPIGVVEEPTGKSAGGGFGPRRHPGGRSGGRISIRTPRGARASRRRRCGLAPPGAAYGPETCRAAGRLGPW